PPARQPNVSRTSTMTRTHKSKSGSHSKAGKDGMSPQMWARLREKTNDEVVPVSGFQNDPIQTLAEPEISQRSEPLTLPCQFGMLQLRPGTTNAIRSIETARLHHACRRRGGMAAYDARTTSGEDQALGRSISGFGSNTHDSYVAGVPAG